jgi:hypothetical protein
LTDTNDPFYRPDKAKSLSWKGAPVGAKVVMVLDGAATKVQSRNYETGKPDFWDDGNPKYSVVLTGDVKGKRRSLWAAIPSALFFALGDAQDKSGAKFGNGGELTVEYVGDKPNENPRFNASKQFTAKYVPPAPSAESSDPWADEEPPF